ncbi:MAG: serine/threonine protein kinase [Burkholderiales bacterium]|nr:serine/threonine protein kinase [Anaerolineae bacterium]
MAATDPLIGKQLGDYVIKDVLGYGGMARVYRGYDARLDRFAAVKVIDAHLISGDDAEEYRERFLREARAIARLNHQRIVGIYQFGQVGVLYYMATVFIDGRDLRHILKDYAHQGKPMPQVQVLSIIRDIAGALDYAHAGGVIHRDVKPSNIMVTMEGQAVLTDFGLALSVPEGTIGKTFGSVHYIAPEQAVSSAQAVPQSDLYSLGVVLYEMLTGRVPFDDPSTMSVALKHLTDAPPRPSSFNPNLSSEVEAVVMRTLAKEPRDRYQTGEALTQALAAAFATHYDGDTDRITPFANAPFGSLPSRPKSIDDLSAESSNALRALDAPSVKELTGDFKKVTTSGMGSRPSLGGLMDGNRPTRTAVIIAVALVAVVIAVLAMLAGGGGESPDNLTRTALAVVALAASETSAAEALAAPTDEPTVEDEATETTATEEPSATRTPRPSATATDTERETEEPEPTAEEDSTTSAAVAVDVTEEATEETAVAAETEEEETATIAPTRTPRPSATAVEEETEEVDIPTERTTIAPTEDSDEATDDAPSDDEAPEVTNLSTDDASDGEVLLVYDPRTLVLLNRSDETIDVSGLYFIQQKADGTQADFRSNRWINNEQPPTALPAHDCFQIWTAEFRLLGTPNYCDTRHFWLQVSFPRWFWISDVDEATFEVRRGTDVLAVCEVRAGECEVDLQLDDEET